MKLCFFRHKRIVSFGLIIFLLLFSICNFQYNPCYKSDFDAASSGNESFTNSLEVSDILFVEEQTFSASNIGFFRHTFSKRSSYDTVIYNILSVLLATFIIWASLLFSYIQMKDIENSLKYTINYIHRKDGLKK